MAEAHAQIVVVYRGEEPVIPFAPATATSVAGKELVLYLAVYFGTPPTYTFTEADGLTVTDETAGEFSWTITRARLLLLTDERYTFELWDLTADERLAGGTLIVHPSSRPTSA